MRWFIPASAFALFVGLLVPPIARTQTDSRLDIQDVPYRKHGVEGPWSSEERARELDIWHDLNRMRLAQTHRLGPAGIGVDAVVTDFDDISVIQDDGTLTISENFFDLNGRAVAALPSGSSYVITSSPAGFDASLGAKLDLTRPPAFNGTVAEPGDDAYILQELGFSFSFYGVSYSMVAVTSNGNLTFRPSGVTDAFFNTNSIDSGESLSDLQMTLPRIAPYWNDLDARASATQGESGVYFRRDGDRAVITWNNVRDFPNDPNNDIGVHRFQVTLFNDGRIVFTYATAQLTQTALAGISPGNSTQTPTLVDLNNPPAGAIGGPIAEFFTRTLTVDLNAIVRAFYIAHPNQDNYDFVYFLTDFRFDLGGGAFAFYRGLSNNVTGIGSTVFESTTKQVIGSLRIQGIINLNSIDTAYPQLPSERMVNIGGADDALSLFGQEQGHRWLARPRYTGADPNLLLGRSNSHWNFFLNIESTISGLASRRSSSMEGSVWRENSNGTFTTLNLVDGYSRLDHYLMGFRPPADVPDTFVITNPTNTNRTRSSNPSPNVTVGGTNQTVTINEIIQANGARNPDATSSPKSFNAAFILFVRRGTQPSPEMLSKLKLFRLAWESYFAQATDYLARIRTGLAAQMVSRVVVAVSAGSYAQTLAPGGISALFGSEITDDTAIATSQPLPETLAGVQVLVNGTPAPLFFASPGQINFQVPHNVPATTNNAFTGFVPSGAVTIQVVRDGQLIRAGVFQIAPSVPAVFTLDQSGTGSATALDAFTFAGPPFDATRAGGQPNVIAVFGTGLGADATDVDGNVSSGVNATIDGNPAPVLYAGRAPGFTGLNQLNVMFPSGITSGTHTLVLARNGVPSNVVTVAIR